MIIENKVMNHIKRYGPVSYSEFMQLCLYEFEDSYYRKQDRIGFHGDFYTSPFLHPVFGSLIAIKLFDMWNSLGQPNSFDVVELGSGNGKLCRDILDYARHISKEFYDAIKYSCVDVRPLTFEDLSEHEDKVQSIDLERLLVSKIQGCILSNEFFDALPIDRVYREKNGWYEIKIEWYETGLRDVYVPLVEGPVLSQIDKWGLNIPEGCIAEVSTIFESMIASLERILDNGFILTIDYGDLSEDLYGNPVRKHGTIRSFKNNVQVANVLDVPGTQDITSHVNFSMLIQKGLDVGLKLEEFISQRTFMMNLGSEWMLKKLEKGSLERSIYILNKRRIESLLDESGLGGFKVLVQSKKATLINHFLEKDSSNRLKVPILN